LDAAMERLKGLLNEIRVPASCEVVQMDGVCIVTLLCVSSRCHVACGYFMHDEWVKSEPDHCHIPLLLSLAVVEQQPFRSQWCLERGIRWGCQQSHSRLLQYRLFEVCHRLMANLNVFLEGVGAWNVGLYLLSSVLFLALPCLTSAIPPASLHSTNSVAFLPLPPPPAASDKADDLYLTRMSALCHELPPTMLVRGGSDKSIMTTDL